MQTAEQTCAATPGPWEAFDAKNEHGEETISIRGDGEFIATMDTVAIGSGPYALPPKARANARLIAQSPALLETAKNLLAVARTHYRTLPDDGPEQDHLMTSYIEPAEQAIAKAEAHNA